jgi:hypothetical protein
MVVKERERNRKEEGGWAGSRSAITNNNNAFKLMSPMANINE